MAKEIKIGSVVTLKSDYGPEYQYMTVNNIDFSQSNNDYVICKWFLDGEIKAASFNKLALVCNEK